MYRDNGKKNIQMRGITSKSAVMCKVKVKGRNKIKSKFLKGKRKAECLGLITNITTMTE